MRIREDALTFDDVLLIPRFSNVLPRDVNLATRLTRDISINIPMLSAAMDTVTEARLAIALAAEGGIGVIHKNMTIEQQADQVRLVKKFESGVIKNPITISPDTLIGEVVKLTRKNNISGVPVVDGENLVGIVTHRDLRFEKRRDLPVSTVMTPKDRLITVKEGAEREEVLALFHTHRIEKVLVVNDAFQLRGLITVKDIQKAKDYPQAAKDEHGQLRCGAAVGVGAGSDERVEALVAAGVDIITVDTAHGHSNGVIEQVRSVKKRFSNIQVIAGNVATAEGAIALAEAGADAIKVGIGPGSICTTRMIAGVGVPQVSAVSNAVKAVEKKFGIPVIADGGVRYSGDICKALAAGASCVMLGSMFAGTEEAPGEVELYQGRSYKTYRGMGSLGAMSQTHGSSDRYFQESNEVEKLVPEGIEGRVPYKGTLLSVITQLLGGIRASMGYLGCSDIETMRNEAEFVRITNAGIRESHVHDVTITKEAPNYRL